MTTPAPEVETPVHWDDKTTKILHPACGAKFYVGGWITDIQRLVTCPACKKIMQGGQK